MMAHSSSTSSRRHEGSMSSRSFVEVVDWEGNETLRIRELEEARARAAQMEKTMRWWSDCTANWREKWSKVRNERNKTREEAKMLRSKLDAALKDVNSFKREKQELESHNEQMRKELERIHLLLLKHAGQWDNQLIEALDGVESGEGGTLGCSELLGGGGESSQTEDGESIKTVLSPSEISQGSSSKRESPVGREDDDLQKKKILSLQQKLDEANKSLQIEKLEKAGLESRIEKLDDEVNDCRKRCEELRLSRQEAVKELLQLQDQHADTLALIRADLVDETNTREGMDRRLADLRAQLERLQAENAAEWGKRERLETDKLSLEREVKRLKGELRDAQERLEQKSKGYPQGYADSSHLHQEISDKTKELSELKHAYNKMKKIMSDKTAELAHVTRRAEQYEAEVKRLRSRVDELKRELAVAEDEVDSAVNNIRKLQRSNDELHEQIEGLQVQIDHLHTRSESDVPSINQEDLNDFEKYLVKLSESS